MMDYEKLRITKEYVKRIRETNLDCSGEDYDKLEYCCICKEREDCKKAYDSNKIEREAAIKESLLFTQEQKDWIKVYVTQAVADGIQDFFVHMEEAIQEEIGGVEIESI